MNRRALWLALVLGWCALGVDAGPAAAQPERRDHRRPRDPAPPDQTPPRPQQDVKVRNYKATWDQGGWVLLGERRVDGKRDKDVIRVGKRDGVYSKLMVVVEDSDLELGSMDIEFGNGERFSPEVKHHFHENERTRPIDLPGNTRAIEKISFRYGNVAGGGRARVAVWGRTGGPGGDPGGPPRDPRDPRADGPRDHRGRPVVTDYWPRAGRPGTEVVILGRRFAPDTMINFGGQVLRPTKVDFGELRFRVPDAAGNVPIVLQRERQRDILVGSFEVNKVDPRAERERWRSERRRAAYTWWKKRQREIARDAAKREAELAAAEEALERERDRRRQARLVELRAKWQADFLQHGDVRAEMALHADREARLDRMMRLAEAGNFGDLAIRIRVLLDTEYLRHDRRMDDLKAALASERR
jgi:hypothetical protein